MNKTYDYHSVKNYKMMLFVLFFFFSGLSLLIFIIEPSLSGKLFALTLAILLITIPTLAYINKKDTYIALGEAGISFHGWKKRIDATWAEVREIKMLTPLKASYRYKIYTDKGCFIVGTVELAREDSFTTFDLLKSDRSKYQKELIEEIKKRAPHAKLTYSILNRPL